MSLPSGPQLLEFFPTAHSFCVFSSHFATEEEQRKETLISKEAESKRVELVAALAQPVRTNHITWSDDAHRQQQQQQPLPAHQPAALPLPSLPPPQVPITIIPMVPVVSATPSVPPLPLTTPITAAATALDGSPPAKNASSPPKPLPQQQHLQQQQQQPVSPHLLCTPQVKVDASQQLVGAKPGQSQPQVQIQFPTAISANGSTSQHALAPLQVSPASQPRTNGVTIDDMRGMEGKRRPGGSVPRHWLGQEVTQISLKVCLTLWFCLQSGNQGGAQ